LLGGLTHAQRIIEIGPSYNPIAPKAGGWNTHIVDHADRDTLRTKYASAGVDVGVIEVVDTIWQRGPLHEAVPSELVGAFDALIASHVLEHVPDLIAFLDSAAVLMRRTGRISAALPDQRYCFDCFRPISTTGDVLEAHADRRTRHSLRTAWDHTAYAATGDGGLGWGPHPVQRLEFIDPFEASVGVWRAAGRNPTSDYVDYHAWQFTPASVALVVLELGQLGVIDWHVESLSATENFEFFVVLRRGAERIEDPALLQSRRKELLYQRLAEVREQIEFALPGKANPGAPNADLPEVRDRLDMREEPWRMVRSTMARLRSRLRPGGGLGGRLRSQVPEAK
jgi:hypothetical protein